MPYRRRRRKNRYEWVAGVVLGVLLIWMAGIRIHPDEIMAGFLAGKSHRVYWRMTLKDGTHYIGKLVYDTPDAVTLETRDEHKTAVKPDIAKLEPLSAKETKELRKEGVIEPLGESPFLTWRKEDMFFSGLRFDSSAQSGGTLNQALVNHAVKNLPKEGFGGFSKDSITKALNQGKGLDPVTLQRYKQQFIEKQKKR